MGRCRARPGRHKATWVLSPAGRSARGTCSATNLRLVGLFPDTAKLRCRLKGPTTADTKNVQVTIMAYT